VEELVHSNAPWAQRAKTTQLTAAILKPEALTVLEPAFVIQVALTKECLVVEYPPFNVQREHIVLTTLLMNVTPLMAVLIVVVSANAMLRLLPVALMKECLVPE